MKKVKCVNGHFFDIERFSACPICGAGVTGAELVPAEKTTADTADYTMPLSALEGERDPFANPVATSLATPKQSLERQEPLNNSSKAFHRTVDELAPTESLQTDDQQTLENNKDVEATHVEVSIPASTKDKKPVAPPSADAEVTPPNGIAVLPKTMENNSIDEVKPPVGWLVCIKGEYAGCAFECKTGRNRIGRNGNMEICLLHDASISREIHAIVIYEPKQRIFYLQVGTSDGLTYLNGNYLFDHSELHAFDKIELGKAEFLFVPLCGEKFTWDDYIKRD